MLTLGGGFSAGYRWDRLRAWKQNASGQRTYFYYDGDGNVLAETDSLGNVTAVNDFAPDGLVGRKTNNTWVYYAFETQGNDIYRLALPADGRSGREATARVWLGRRREGDFKPLTKNPS